METYNLLINFTKTADLLDLLKASMRDEVLDQGSQIGVKDRKKTKDVASGAFSVLMDAMQRKAKDDKGSVGFSKENRSFQLT